MSRLPEHAVKRILNSAGVAVPGGTLCSSAAAAEAAARAIGDAVFVKAQVALGDRAASGGVVMAPTPRAAAASANAMLGTSFGGQRCESVLVEAKLDPVDTYFAAVRVSPSDAARELLFGRGGGSGYDAASVDVRLVVSPAARPFQVRDALADLGFKGQELIQVAETLLALQRCAIAWHAYVLEVNPLFRTPAGIVAIDAKLEVDDYSASSVPDPAVLAAVHRADRERRALEFQARDHRGSLRFVELAGRPRRNDRLIGTHSVGGGESLVVLDALATVGLEAANYCDTSGSPSAEKVAFAAELIATQPGIRGYLFSTCIANQPLSVTARGLLDGFRNSGWAGPTVIRIAGNEEEIATAMLREWGDSHPAPVRVLGREANEWDAAMAMSDMLTVAG